MKSTLNVIYFIFVIELKSNVNPLTNVALYLFVDTVAQPLMAVAFPKLFPLLSNNAIYTVVDEVAVLSE